MVQEFILHDRPHIKDFAWVETTVLDKGSPCPGAVKRAKLPMLDPHELLNWLWVTGAVEVKSSDIESLRLNFKRLRYNS